MTCLHQALCAALVALACSSKSGNVGSTRVEPGASPPEASPSSSPTSVWDQYPDFQSFTVVVAPYGWTRELLRDGVARATDDQGTVEMSLTDAELTTVLPLVMSEQMRAALEASDCPTAFDTSATFSLTLDEGSIEDPFGAGCGDDRSHPYMQVVYALIEIQKHYYQCPDVDAEYDGQLRGICAACYSWPGGCVNPGP